MSGIIPLLLTAVALAVALATRYIVIHKGNPASPKKTSEKRPAGDSSGPPAGRGAKDGPSPSKPAVSSADQSDGVKKKPASTPEPAAAPSDARKEAKDKSSPAPVSAALDNPPKEAREKAASVSKPAAVAVDTQKTDKEKSSARSERSEAEYRSPDNPRENIVKKPEKKVYLDLKKILSSNKNPNPYSLKLNIAPPKHDKKAEKSSTPTASQKQEPIRIKEKSSEPKAIEPANETRGAAKNEKHAEETGDVFQVKEHAEEVPEAPAGPQYTEGTLKACFTKEPFQPAPGLALPAEAHSADSDSKQNEQSTNKAAAVSKTARKPLIDDVRKLKNKGYGSFTAVTATDYFQASFASEAGATILNVNDVAVSRYLLGRPEGFDYSTTLDEIIMATKAVKNGSGASLVIPSIPFGYYNTPGEAAAAATRIMKETGADAVHMEGARPECIKAVCMAGWPVLGHAGLNKFLFSSTGNRRFTGRTTEEAQSVLDYCKEIESAGVFAIVLEGLPEPLARIITDSVSICTCGIGAGKYCNGQFLVAEDIMGYDSSFSPRYVKKYLDVECYVRNGIKAFAEDVAAGTFPDREHSYNVTDEAYLSKVN